jgi:hypothetical protein
MIRLLCSPDFKTEWQLEVGNLFNAVLIGTSGSQFPDWPACNGAYTGDGGYTGDPPVRLTRRGNFPAPTEQGGTTGGLHPAVSSRRSSRWNRLL